VSSKYIPKESSSLTNTNNKTKKEGKHVKA
jgi:hypothetical protein